MKQPAVIFDIDGTLADCEHRRHFLRDGKNDWRSFLDPDLVMQDRCIQPVARLARILHTSGGSILIVSARNELHREVTSQWLHHNALYHEKLYLRPDGDFRPDTDFKQETLEQIRADGYEPWLVIDDRTCVVEMWRSNGITCLQAADLTAGRPEYAQPIS